MHLRLLSSLLLFTAISSAGRPRWDVEERPARYVQALIFPYASATFEAISKPLRWIANGYTMRKPAMQAPVDRNAAITVVPSYANWTGDHWSMLVHGNAHVLNPLSNKRLDTLLNRLLIRAHVPKNSKYPSKPTNSKKNQKAPKHYTLNETEHKFARDRVQAIAHGGLHGLELSVSVLCARSGNTSTTLYLANVTGHDGAFSEVVALPKDCVPSGNAMGPLTTLSLEVTEAHEKSRKVAGGGTNVTLVPPTGLTFVSDIDDTLRVSEVWNPKQAILSTLARPFVPWSTMPSIFASWKKTIPRAHFHYATDTPELNDEFYVNSTKDQNGKYLLYSARSHRLIEIQADWHKPDTSAFVSLDKHKYHFFNEASELARLSTEHLKHLAADAINSTYTLSAPIDASSLQPDQANSTGVHRYKVDGCFPPYAPPGSDIFQSTKPQDSLVVNTRHHSRLLSVLRAAWWRLQCDILIKRPSTWCKFDLREEEDWALRGKRWDKQSMRAVPIGK
ncbi:hypothetical protein ANO11243_011640 [Dothideomycetidae sp. 11243]|nr:hypothetical protein ANO11243_011640 [fungal sp. No.11243]